MRKTVIFIFSVVLSFNFLLNNVQAFAKSESKDDLEKMREEAMKAFGQARKRNIVHSEANFTEKRSNYNENFLETISRTQEASPGNNIASQFVQTEKEELIEASFLEKVIGIIRDILSI